MKFDFKSMNILINSHTASVDNVDFDKGKSIMTFCKEDLFKGEVIVEITDGALCVSVNFECLGLPYDYANTFDSIDSILLDIPIEGVIDGALSQQNYNPFWAQPCFETEAKKLPDGIQNMLIKSDGRYYNILPMANKDFISTITASGSNDVFRIRISKLYSGSKHVTGIIFTVSDSENPYNAIKNNYDFAISKKIINSSIKKEKKYPDAFNYIGWCTWNAFYHDVNDAKIKEKLYEFKSKKIPIGWILIDDGWSKEKGFKLQSLYEDKQSFPSGLKNFVNEIKSDYGIKYIGLWHSMTGYWFGIDKSSDLYDSQVNNLEITNSEYCIPYNFEFYDTWHTYLKNCGIDFLKVDTQGNALEFAKNMFKPCHKVLNAKQGLEQSAKKHFDSNLINCMAMANIFQLNNTYSAVSRTSDDFYPEKEESFVNHLLQNVYNSVFSDYLFYSDFDMYWSKNTVAKQSSVLRAISGGPIYLSDKLNDSNAEYIMPLIESDGRILKCDNICRPTDDCLFSDTHNKYLKVYNNCGDCGVVAVFNFENNQKIKVFVKDFNGNGNYAAYLYFAKKIIPVSDGTIEIELNKNDTEIINFYPVKDNKIYIGDTNKYISCASTTKRTIDLNSANQSILQNDFTTNF